MSKVPNPAKDDPKRFQWKWCLGVTCPLCRGHEISVRYEDAIKPREELRQYRCHSCAYLFSAKLPQKLSGIRRVPK